MNAKDSVSLIGPGEKRPSPWRNSLYDEPVWVSVAWIVGPVVVAALVIYFALR